ncbi:glutathione S-transferase 1-like [Rhopilema esculentum]|uniref:glutathione S-transferase 1-like n=1 Tax=Rhopilema esculentum TaxID=499914 RepID=UPI0031D05FFA
MILYASMSSTELRAIRFYLESSNISCCYYDLDTGNKEETKASLLRKNPSGIVPFLEDSDNIVLGTVPILLYLAETHANFAMCGKTLEDRAKVESVLMWASASLARSVFYDFAAPRLHESHSIGEFESIHLVTHGKSEIIEHFDVLEKHYLNNNNNNTKYLVNNELTLADVYTAITISFLEPLLFDFSPWPGLCKWFEGIKSAIAQTSQKNMLTRLLSFNRTTVAV